MRLPCVVLRFYLVFFFKQKTAYEMRISDWSSDVCSSDLPTDAEIALASGLIDAFCPADALIDHTVRLAREATGEEPRRTGANRGEPTRANGGCRVAS